MNVHKTVEFNQEGSVTTGLTILHADAKTASKEIAEFLKRQSWKDWTMVQLTFTSVDTSSFHKEQTKERRNEK
jgi:hypothetical protein